MNEEPGESVAKTRRVGLSGLTAPRHSLAALRSARSRGRRRSVLVALCANVAIAVAKLAAGLITGSSALLAESAHSAADSVNEVLLGLSLRRARRPADARHQFGYGGTRFLWAFLAALFSFLVGGCVSVALGIHELTSKAHIDQFLIGWVVLAVAFIADGSALLVSLRAARREAAQWNQTVPTFLRQTSDPTLRALVVEDGAALVGLSLAAGGLFLHQVAGWAQADGIASVLIGVLLAATAVGLARPLAELLIGESMQPARLQSAYDILAGSPSFEEVVSMRAVYVAPQEVIVAAKLHPRPNQTGEQLALALDELDRTLREALPEIADVYLDLTSHSRDERPE